MTDSDREWERQHFGQMIKSARENLTDTPPSDPKEFDIYADTNYNMYMFIKGEWKFIGTNIRFLD